LTVEFKEKVVKEYLEKIYKPKEIVEKYMITENLINKWVRKKKSGRVFRDSQTLEKVSHFLVKAFEILELKEDLNNWRI